jgi:eukaryotic-like serine/threonine-protein kinase
MNDQTETVPPRGEGPRPEAPGAEGLDRGAAVGRYVVLDRIGAGGMGVVYAAYDPELDRRVALKLLRPDRFGGEAGRSRLLREAQALARLTHPNVVAVHDAGTFGDRVFVAMELVEGETLRQWLEAEPRSWREVLDRFLPAGRGLAAAHAAGLVHRDFKPENVLLGRDGRVRVVDFGLAKALADAAEEPAEALAEPGGGTPLTEWGVVLGTPAYMAPEQVRGIAADARSDQFSFCVALYEALYGERPFAGEGVVREAPAGTRVPGWLRAVVLRGLKASPEERYPAMDGLLRDLEGDPEAVRRRWLAAAAIVVLAGGIFGGLGYFQARRAQLCGGADEKLAGVWSLERRRAIHTAFLATRLPFAEDAWTAVERGMDGYVRSWATMRHEACEATRVRGEQSADLLDRRMLCLDQRLGQVDTLADLLARADSQTVQRWPRLLDGLDGLAECGNAVTLLGRTPLPRDAASRARIQKAQARLAQSRALQAAGKIQPALALAVDVDREAGGLSYKPLQGEATFLLGDLRENAGDLQASKRDVYRALEAAEAGRDDLLKARCWKKLIYVAGFRESHFEEAHRLARLAEAALARAGGDPSWEAAILDIEASIYSMEGKYQDALREFNRVLALSERYHLQNSFYTTANNLGSLYHEMGDHERALQSFRQALDQAGPLKGDLHPDTAALEYNLGTVLTDLKRYSEAEVHLRKALATRERILEPDHPDIAESLTGLGVLWDRQDRPEQSLPYQERALRIYTARNPGSIGWATAQNNVGDDLRKLGRYPEAVAHLQEGLTALAAGAGADTIYMAGLLDTLGNIYLDWGRPAGAVQPLARAVAILERQGAPEDRADTELSLARALWDGGGSRERALALAHQAREGFARAGDVHREELAKVDQWLSRHERPTGTSL